MKRTRLTALVMGLLLMATLAFAEAAPVTAPESPALATVNGEDITKAQADELIPALVNYQYIADASDYTATVDFLVRQKVLAKKISDMGFDQFTPEELTAFEQEAQAEWEAALSEYADYIQSDDSEQARAHAMEQAAAFYQTQGLTLEMLLNSVKNSAAQDKMTGYLMGGYQPTEEEIQAIFEQVGPVYQEKYESDIQTYEYMTRFSGQTSWYTPAGYRGIIHILLTGDQELVNRVRTLEARFEEQQQQEPAEESAEETAEIASVETVGEAADEAAEEPVTQEMIQAARQAVLDDKADVITEIYNRLDSGESFENLIGEYGEDPGMTVPDNLENGYPVHQDSIIWDPAFVTGAFSDKMIQAGDVSDPLVGANGIHILKYLKDIPSGLIMTDAIHEEITQFLTGARENEVYGQAFEGWMAEMDIVYHQDAIDQAIQEAAALAQSVEELPPEAVENP
ncbi:MAG: hypothetical protein PHP02_05785 [Eubacteriales bacterium]|nr:hypothetical protein [Eubacteriales bacterium]